MGTSLSITGIVWSIMSLLTMSIISVGYFMPYWLEGTIAVDGLIHTTDLGVFRRCNYLARTQSAPDRIVEVIAECGRYTTFWNIPSVWWQIATVSIGVGCGLSILISFCALLCCCMDDSITRVTAKLAGILQLLAGVAIACGCAIYPLGWNSHEVRQACGPQAGRFNLGTCTISWAYYATMAGGAALFLCAILACLATRTKGGYQRAPTRV